MRDVKKRLEKLEAASEQETPWWTLPLGKEPDWPRPLAHWSDEELEEMSHRDIEEYCDALEQGREYRPTYEEVWLNQEVFHESRWRKHGIARRSTSMSPPEGWEQTQQLHKKEEEYE